MLWRRGKDALCSTGVVVVLSYFPKNKRAPRWKPCVGLLRWYGSRNALVSIVQDLLYATRTIPQEGRKVSWRAGRTCPGEKAHALNSNSCLRSSSVRRIQTGEETSATKAEPRCGSSSSPARTHYIGEHPHDQNLSCKTSRTIC